MLASNNRFNLYSGVKCLHLAIYHYGVSGGEVLATLILGAYRETMLDSDTYLYDLSGYTKDDMNYAMASYSVYLEKLGYTVDISNSKVDHTGVYVPIAKDGVAVGATMQVKDNGNWFIIIMSVE